MISDNVAELSIFIGRRLGAENRGSETFRVLASGIRLRKAHNSECFAFVGKGVWLATQTKVSMAFFGASVNV